MPAIFNKILTLNPLDKLKGVNIPLILFGVMAIIIVIMFIKASTSRNPSRNIFIVMILVGFMFLIYATVSFNNPLFSKTTDSVNKLVQNSSNAITSVQKDVTNTIAAIL